MAQDYQLEFRHIGIQDGLLHREVNAIHQDKNGFLWMATPLGINRFDGYRFKYYSQLSHGFQNNRFDQIVEDQAGRLWFIDLLGNDREGQVNFIDILVPEKDSIFSFQELFPDQVMDFKGPFLSSPTGELLFQRADSLALIYYSVEEGFREVLVEGGIPFSMVFLSPHETLWGRTSPTMLQEINLEGKKLQHLEFELTTMIGSPAPQTSSGFYVVLLGTRGRFEQAFIDWEGKRKILNADEWTSDHFTGPKLSFISCLFQERIFEGPQIIADTSIWNQLKSYFLKKEGRIFRDFLKTSDQTIWVGGNFGAYQIRIKKNPFRRYFAIPFDKNFQYDRSERLAGRGIWAKNQQLIVNLEPYSTHKLDLSTGISKTLSIDEDHLNISLALANWKDSLFFIGKHRRVLLVNAAFEVKKSWNLNGEKDVWALLPADDRYVWLGMGRENGLGLLDTESGSVLASSNHKPFAPLLGKNIVHIEAGNQHDLWICSDKGLYHFSLKDSTFEYLGRRGEGKNHLPADDFLHIYRETDSIFWLATRGQGLIRWNKQKGEYQQFTRESGLPNNTIYGMYEDAHNNLWMPSDYGIIQFNKETFSSKSFLPEDGTSEVEFNRISHTVDEQGNLYFGSINGITAFHPDDFYGNENSIQPPLRISGFKQFDVLQNQFVDGYSSLLNSNKIVISPDQTEFLLELSLLNYENEDLNQFIWRIEGLEENWHVQSDPTIQLSRLPYGKYHLVVKGKTRKGEASANEIHLALHVIPPFYKTTGFIIMVVLIVLLLAGFIIYFRFRQLKRNQQLLRQKVAEATKELREMDHLKTRLFANVSHELRTPLSLMLGPISSILKHEQVTRRTKEYLQLARQNGRSLQRLITEILDLGKLESGKMTLQEAPVNFSAILQKTAASFEAWAENKHIQFDFQTDLAADTHLICDKIMVERILNNLLSNAVKFTPEGGKITLQCEVTSSQPQSASMSAANYLLMIVTDTGPGIHPDDLPYIFDRYYQAQKSEQKLSGGTGIGLALSKELAELMGGSLQAKSYWTDSDKSGSEFIFTLPFQQLEVDEEGVLDIIEGHAEVIPKRFFESARTTGNGQKVSVLVVEDNDDLRNFIQALLQPYYDVTVARHGKEALAELKENQEIKLVLTDLMMPEMDGMALLEAIKSNDTLYHLPVIILTARTALSEKLKALRLGVHDYLTKPFEEEELLARIDNLLTWAVSRNEENTSEKDPNTFSYHEKWLQQVDEWVAQNYVTPDVKMMDWADHIHLSESQFRRRLKKATGLSPLQYLLAYRLRAARQLLENVSFPTVRQVASATGFNSPDYFNRVYQRQYGKAPSTYL